MSLTVDTIAQQEKDLILTELNDAVAFKLGVAAREYALAHHKDSSVVIDITTAAGATLFRSYIGQIQPDNEHWVKVKRNTVIRFERSSKKFGLELAAKGRTLEDRALTSAEYTPYGGGFPIRIQAAPSYTLAVITVSGLTDVEDHAVCVEALKAVL